MIGVDSTRLRFVKSKNAEKLQSWISLLPYKVEIKSIANDGSKWFVWYVVPDKDLTREIIGGDLDA